MTSRQKRGSREPRTKKPVESGRDNSLKSPAPRASRKPYGTSNPEFLSTSQVGRRLGVCRRTVQKMYEENQLTGIKVGKYLRILVASVNHYLRTHSNYAQAGEGVSRGE